MATTGHGPASTTVTRSTRPSSWKTWVIPTLRPSSAAIRSTGSGCPRPPAGGRAAGASRPSSASAGDVDQALVRTDLEVLAGVLVLEGTADHAVAVLLRRQRHGARDRRAGASGRLDDLASGLLDGRRVVGLEPDADFVLRKSCHGGPLDARRAGL